jgi:quinol monooxygenase YgiN
VLEDDRDPNRLYLHEGYVDQAAFEAHKQGPWYKIGMDVLRAQRERGVLTVEPLLRAHSLFAGPRGH